MPTRGAPFAPAAYHGRMLRSRRSAKPDPERTSRLREVLTDRIGMWSIRSLQIVAILLLAGVVVWALTHVRLLVIPALIAIILAAAASPLLALLRRHGVAPMLAAWIVLLGAVVVLGGVVTGIVYAVRGEWDSIVESAANGYSELESFVNGVLPGDTIPWDDIRDQIVAFATSAQFGSGAIAGVSTAVEIVTGMLLGIVILFFLLKDGDRIWAFLLTPFRAENQERGVRIGRAAAHTLGGYARGTVLIAAVDAIGIGIPLLILQVPLAIPLAALVFLGAFIPMVGATVTGIIASLVTLVTNGLPAALIVGAVIILVQQLEGNLLQPVIMSQSVRLHPLAILAALTVGTVLGGIAGAVLAVPVAAVGWAIIKNWDPPSDRATTKDPPEVPAT